MSLYKRGATWWAAFSVDGVMYRKSTGKNAKNDAKVRERELIGEAEAGHLTKKRERPTRLFAAIGAYLDDKKIRVSTRTVELEQERLSIIKKHFKDVALTSVSASAIAAYQKVRKESGTANRTNNMDVGVLSRVLAFCGHWRRLKEHVKLLEDQPSDIGWALTHEELDRLIKCASSYPRWEHAYCAAVLASRTTMRPIEVKNLQRKHVDLFKKELVVGRAKGRHGKNRRIPLDADALKAVSRMFDRADALGFTDPEHYLWFACKNGRFDPTKPIKKWDTAWRALRKKAGLDGFRFHDLRHTFITHLAEAGVPEHVIRAFAGHLTKRMLEHYMHIGMAAKRQALTDVAEQREQALTQPYGEDGSESRKQSDHPDTTIQ